MIKRAPLAWISAAFAAGIGFSAWAVLLLLAGMALVRRPPRCDLILLGLAAALGLARAQVDRLPASGSIASWIEAGGRPVQLTGVLAGDPERWGRVFNSWLKVEGIRAGEEWQPVSGKIQARWPVRSGLFEYGDRLELTGLLRPGAAARSGCSFQEAHWLWVKGASGVLTVSDPEGVSRRETGTGAWVRYRRWVGRLRRRLAALSEEFLEAEDAGLLNGLVVGDGQGISKRTWEAFKKTGTVHVLVVSGMHVGLIGMIQLLILSVMGVPRTLRYGLLGAGLVTYCLLAGMNPPILRSTFTGLLLCWAWARGVEVSSLNLLGAAAWVMLAADPRLLEDAGFQLSFASVGAILAVMPWLFRLPPGRISRYVVQPLAVSFAAWLATLPILMAQFGAFSWIAPFLNMVVIPWASLLITVGFMVYAGGLVSPFLGGVFAAVFHLLAAGLVGLVQGIT